MRLLLAAAMVTVVASLGAAQPAPPADAAQLAMATLDQLASGDHAAVFARFDEKMRAAVPEEKLRGLWSALAGQLGALRRRAEPRVERKGDYRITVTTVEFEKGSADVQLVFAADGRIAGLFIRPAAPAAPFTDASYVERTRFIEHEVTVDAGGWPLPGTLAVPSGTGPFPAVVLVQGSGPGDRDSSIGPNKPLRDLALGLASKGIATLRYEKRTRQHGPRVVSNRKFTVKDEVIDDVVAAVQLLGGRADVDKRRIFVAGHSLGGMLVPRIAAAAGDAVRGFIVLAGAVRSLEQSLVDQSRYLALADGTITPEEQAQLDAFAALPAKVKALSADDPPLSAGPGISAPASYWVDLRGYDPPLAARAMQQPLLILQGGRDYQVTTADFEQWRTALAGRSTVVFKAYPSLNHLFMAGTGPSLPQEYFTAGHVADAVVSDIAAWVLSHP